MGTTDQIRKEDDKFMRTLWSQEPGVIRDRGNGRTNLLQCCMFNDIQFRDGELSGERRTASGGKGARD